METLLTYLQYSITKEILYKYKVLNTNDSGYNYIDSTNYYFFLGALTKNAPHFVPLYKKTILDSFDGDKVLIHDDIEIGCSGYTQVPKKLLEYWNNINNK